MTNEKRDDAAKRGSAGGPSGAHPPAGNKQFDTSDPRGPSRRDDMPQEDQHTSGKTMRGNQPSQSPDRSHQPHREEQRRDELGPATSSGGRGG